jgi:carnosine N-methyltransferase
MINSQKFILFGYKQEDEESIHSKIDFAIDKYSGLLTDIMIYVESVIEALENADERLGGKFVDVHADFGRQLLRIPEQWEQNKMVLEMLLRSNTSFTYGICSVASILSDNNQHSDQSVTVTSYGDDLQQLLVHLSRDWGNVGEHIRKKLYEEGVLKHLQMHSSYSTGKKLLVPGAGLGRLGYELASLGYEVELNEASGVMAVAMSSIINNIIPSGISFNFFPNMHLRFSDDWSLKHRLKPSIFPCIEAHRLIEPRPKSLSLTIQHGDFAEVYSDLSREKFDYVVTSFFMDTAPDIILYLTIIGNILNAGGLWINIGPLHYHNTSSIPYSFDYLTQMIELSGFSLIEHNRISSSYAGEEEFTMKPEHYNVPLSTWRLTNVDNVIPIQSYNTTGRKKSSAATNFTSKFTLKK